MKATDKEEISKMNRATDRAAIALGFIMCLGMMVAIIIGLIKS